MQDQYDEEKAKELERKIKKNQFDFNDFLEQIKQIKKMGNLKDLLGMIPGVGKAIRDLDVDDDAFKGIEAIIYSMTPEERENPKIIDGNRRKRIAAGSGVEVAQVNQLLKQFEQARKVMQLMGGAKGGRRGMNMGALKRQMGGR